MIFITKGNTKELIKGRNNWLREVLLDWNEAGFSVGRENSVKRGPGECGEKKTMLTVFILGIWVLTWFSFSVNVVEVCRWGVKERWRTRMSAKPFPAKWSATSSSWAGKWGGAILRNGGIWLQPSKPLLENENKAGSPRKKRLPWLSPDR